MVSPIIQFDPEFVREFGAKYTSVLSESYMKAFSILKKKTPTTNVIVSNKNVSLWRDKKTKEVIKSKGDYIKELYLQLNKLSETNLETICFQIDKIIKDSNDYKSDITEKLIERLFQSAKIQINFCHLYAQVFYNLIKKDRAIYFNPIQTKIKEEFKMLSQMVRKEHNENYDEYCDSIKIKENYIGCYQFCIELFNHNVLTFKNIEQIINNVIKDLDEKEEKYHLEIIVEALCRILKTLKKIEKIEKDNLNTIINNIREAFMRNKKKLSSRPRFILEDALALD